jgi:quercetin dioxygenase-like cupin family protein
MRGELMSTPYLFFEQLEQEIPEIPADGIVSRLLVNTPEAKITLFGFAAGQALSEHTAARPVLLYIVRGEASITLANQAFSAKPGSLIQMAARLPHSVSAKTELVMLLIMVAGNG